MKVNLLLKGFPVEEGYTEHLCVKGETWKGFNEMSVEKREIKKLYWFPGQSPTHY